MLDFFEHKIKQDKNSLKWSKSNINNADLIPMWVADMDFQVPEKVIDAIRKRADVGIFGYSITSESYYSSIIQWMKKRHLATVLKEWIVPISGVVTSISTAIQAFTNMGDKIIIQTPIYPPFFSLINNNNRIILENPLIVESNRYLINFEELEEQAKDAEMLLLCNPHNPTGKVFTLEELIKIAEICSKNNVFIFSDEIHLDLVYKPNKHISFLTLNEEYLNNLVVATAPSKTFNIAGLCASNCFIPNDLRRKQFFNQINVNAISDINVFGKTACETAYQQGGAWLDEVIMYIKENRDFAVQYVSEHINKIKIINPDGTYFLWLDCRKHNIENLQLNDFFLNEAGLYLNDGKLFGAPGYMRMNIACRKEVLEIALQKLNNAVEQLSNQG